MTAQPTKIQQLFQTAIQHHQAGRLQQAESIYRQILAAEPRNVYAINLLGVIAKQVGQYEVAISMFRQVIKISPDFEEAYNNLGNVYMMLENLDEAAASFQKALAINPQLAEAHSNLGNVYNEQGHTAEATACYRKALAIRPDYASAYNNLGKLLKGQGDLKQAAACYQKALAINPQLGEAHNNLANVYNEQGHAAHAIASYQKALAINPNHAKAYNNLGRLVKDQGNLTEALDNFKKALAIDPSLTGAYSNLLFTLNYLHDISQADIYQKSRQWNVQYAKALLPEKLSFSNQPEPCRQLRIGYISPDFRTHSVAYFFEPVLLTHNRDSFDIYCYANVAKPDHVTERLQASADHWLSILGKNDAQVVEQIVNDQIDILVDLTGHTGGNRLLVFAHKPAPIQVSWLGYPNTTGLSTIDYRLTDELADPHGEADNLYSEQLVRLENGFLCFQADASSPEVSELPSSRKDSITFGNFNDLAKTTPQVIKLWSEIIRAVPGSSLILKAKQLADEETRARYRAMFEQQGIDPQRIELYGRLAKRQDHLDFYSRVDIGLDPFPYNGTTTTCEALWMGVPVVTMQGDRHAGRVGASIMHHVDLPELVAESTEGYMQLAQSLANDQDSLAEMRRGLRQHMRESTLMNNHIFTRSLEETYRRMWIQWCDGQE